jgi:error-prone DNA polymerase
VVYRALQKADTVGMFQIESRAQMACLPRLHPTCFYDVVVQIAIIRPGPIVGQMVNPYLKRRQGREPVECLHPSLEPVLARTLGVPLFQEQLLRMAMIAAGFTGGEAEELRRAFGFKRSEARMKEVEKKLRRGMDKNGISAEAQEKISQSITSFALYGFPESHAASFALLAYASAYLKCHYLAAFTAAMLNNQPMGFYSPASIVKDAQRHGLRIKPIDVTCSQWLCTLEKLDSSTDKDSQRNKSAADGCVWQFAIRIGLRYVKGLRQEMALELVRERSIRPFTCIEDLHTRLPGLQKSELTALAQIGALNFIDGIRDIHRRDALWQVERAARPAGPLLETSPLEPEAAKDTRRDIKPTVQENTRTVNEPAKTPAAIRSPLLPMTVEERIVADFRGTGMTVGPHPMAYHRAEMKKQGVRSAIELPHLPDGSKVRIAGGVIARQRPGTAKGFVFLSIEDETGIANAIITPQIFERDHLVIVHQQFLFIEGELQNQQNVISVKAARVLPMLMTKAESISHDFH